MALTIGQYHIDLGSGTEAQKPAGAEGQLRWNTTNRSLDNYTNNANSSSDNFFSAVGGRELIYRYVSGSSWSSINLDWGINNARFNRYEVTGTLCDPSGTSRLGIRMIRADGNVDTSNLYGHVSNWRCSNDGQDLADGNRRIDSNPINFFPLSNYDDGSGYYSQANGEQTHTFSFEIGNMVTGTHNQAAYWARAAYQSPNGHYGMTQGGIWNANNSTTGTNGQAWWPVRGVQLFWVDSSNRSVSGVSSMICVYGLGGLEERTL